MSLPMNLMEPITAEEASALQTLPASWYTDPRVLDAEMRTVFASAPNYVGCVGMVPRHRSFRAIPQSDGAFVLVRNGDDIALLSNICLHRGLVMLEGSGETKVIVCPMHRWSYDLDGTLLSAPRYPQTPCASLPRRPLANWNGVLFATQRDVAADLAPFDGRPELDVSRYVYVESEQEEQPVNWKVPIEVLLENYHVPIIHPGLSRFVEPSSWYGVEGFDGDPLMYQEMRPHPDFAHNPGSAAWERWQQAILKITGGVTPPFAAIISLYSPNIFLEWYPFTFVVTMYVPRSPERTLMIRDFFYDPRALEIVPEFPTMSKACWDENQIADDRAHEALQRGRALLHRQDPHAPSGYAVYQYPSEESVRIFHERLMAAVLPVLDATP